MRCLLSYVEPVFSIKHSSSTNTALHCSRACISDPGREQLAPGSSPDVSSQVDAFLPHLRTERTRPNSEGQAAWLFSRRSSGDERSCPVHLLPLHKHMRRLRSSGLQQTNGALFGSLHVDWNFTDYRTTMPLFSYTL